MNINTTYTDLFENKYDLAVKLLRNPNTPRAARERIMQTRFSDRYGSFFCAGSGDRHVDFDCPYNKWEGKPIVKELSKVTVRRWNSLKDDFPLAAPKRRQWMMTKIGKEAGKCPHCNSNLEFFETVADPRYT